MLSFLKNHPFAVEAYFESSLVLTFAVPKSAIDQMIPACLELDVLNDTFAFIAVAMVQTKDLRPKGFPAMLGNDFFLIGYRIFVKFTNKQGKRLRGLYIIKSQTNKKRMEIAGNIFTQYNYMTTDIRYRVEDDKMHISSNESAFSVIADIADKEVDLPKNSPFTDWKEARRFAGPLPFTFTYKPATREVLIIEGVRENWTPKAISILHYNFSFLDSLPIKDIVLANAFIIRDIPYCWKKGKIEKWNS